MSQHKGHKGHQERPDQIGSYLCVLGVLRVDSSCVSRTTVRGVPERAEEQRQVEMLVRIANGERDLDLGKKGDAQALAAMEGADVERQTIRSWRDRRSEERR